VLVVLAVSATAARGQSREEPNLVFSIALGLTTGQELWDLAKQPLPVTGSSPVAFDTVHLARWLRPGIVAALGVTYFRSPHLGYALELGYFGLASEQRCQGPAAWQPDANQLNQQACTGAQGQHVQTSVTALLLGLTYRPLPRSKIEPYLRVGIGPGLTGATSFVTTTAEVQSSGCGTTGCTYFLLDEGKTTSLTWLGSASVGLSYWLGPAYRVKLEGRNVVAAVPYATGPARLTTGGESPAPTGTRVLSVPTFTFGFDVLLERRHPRRY
jgi:hypothetical protein